MVILNEAKPKYEHLDEILEDQLQDIRFSNQVNIIVDLKEILRKFFRPDIDAEIIPRRQLLEEISADIINTIGHYRNYFYKKGKYTTFYILYSKEKCEEILKKIPEYKKEYYEKYFNENDKKAAIIKDVVRVIEKISVQIPHVYFADTSKYDEFVYAKYLKSIIKENELTIILSNDDLFYQLLSKNIFLINLKGIKSELITKENCISKITKKEFSFSSDLLPLVLSISGIKKYSISSVPNVALIKACNIVQKLLNDGKIVDAESVKIPIEFSKLNPKNSLENKLILNKEIITKNYNFIKGDELFFAHKLTIPNDFISNPTKDIHEFLNLNAKIFTSFPLQIDMLLKGEQL